jgi:hypothetical protein
MANSSARRQLRFRRSAASCNVSPNRTVIQLTFRKIVASNPLGHRSPKPSPSSGLPSLQASDPIIPDFTEVLGLVDPAYPNAPADDIDLVDTARVLCNSPIGGQRLIQQFQQERPVHAVIPGRTTMSSTWCFKTKRRASAHRATKSCNDSPSGNRTKCGAANHLAKSCACVLSTSWYVLNCHAP